MIDQQLNIKNCTDYLQSEYFTNIQYQGTIEEMLYFHVIDEEGEEKEVEFEQLDDKKICVSIREKESDEFYIYDILED